MARKVKVSETELKELNAAVVARDSQLEMFQEQLAELELALDDVGWLRMGMMNRYEFSRHGLKRICELAHLMYNKNPLIQRGVNVQAHYVFGQGMNIRAKDPDVNEVVQEFLDDAKNKAELTTHQALMEKEIALQLDANLFFCFFPNASTGKVRLRTIPVHEVEEIVTNPEDSKEPWYYKRVWHQTSLNMNTGLPTSDSKCAFYPDWQYNPDKKADVIGPYPIEWDTPVYHVRTGGTAHQRFGVSEVYAAIDWARAYKEFLENWATIVKAYARFAFNASGMGSQAAVEAMKTKFGSTLPGSLYERNPAPVVASTLVTPGDIKMEPVRTAGATTSAEDGRRLLLQVAAVMGLPETFFGDTKVGTLATAKSLDRPTELKMVSRQTLWADIHRNILNYVIAKAVYTGTLAGTITVDDDGTEKCDLGEGVDPTITVTFPPILEHDVAESVTSIVNAATLEGKPLAGTIDMPVTSRMLLNALGEEDTDAILEQQFPAGESAGESRLIKAVESLEEALVDRDPGTQGSGESPAAG